MADSPRHRRVDLVARAEPLPRVADPVDRRARRATRQTEVIRRVIAEAGLPIDTLAFREFDGRVYTTIVPLGGKARKPPPKALLPILLKVVPELRRRVAASRAWFGEDRPAQVIDEWLGGKEVELRDEGRRLIAIDVDTLSGVRSWPTSSTRRASTPPTLGGGTSDCTARRCGRSGCSGWSSSASTGGATSSSPRSSPDSPMPRRRRARRRTRS